MTKIAEWYPKSNEKTPWTERRESVQGVCRSRNSDYKPVALHQHLRAEARFGPPGWPKNEGLAAASGPTPFGQTQNHLYPIRVDVGFSPTFGSVHPTH